MFTNCIFSELLFIKHHLPAKVGSDLSNLKARTQAIGSEIERKQMTLQPSDVVNINMVKENIKTIEEIMLVVCCIPIVFSMFSF